MRAVTAHYEITLNGKTIEVEIVGRTLRDMTGGIHVEIEKVLTPDGLNVFGVVPESELPAMRARLVCAHIAAAHPRGDSVEVGA